MMGTDNLIISSAIAREERDRSPDASARPWSVDRWGRLLAGSGILLTTALGILHHPAWLIGTLLASSNLVVTSLTGRCPLHDILIRLGAKEREDIFLPGGSVRPDVTQSSDLHSWNETVLHNPVNETRRQPC
jgi:hypothetical protein